MAVLKLKVCKTNAKIKNAFSKSASIEINPNFKRVIQIRVFFFNKKKRRRRKDISGMVTTTTGFFLVSIQVVFPHC